MRAGDLDVAVAGGMESMSQAPYLLPQGRFGARMGDVTALDAMVHDGLTNPFSGKQMFQEATEVGDELELTRADLDRWALRSHRARGRRHGRGAAARGDRPRHRARAARATRWSRSTRRRGATRRSSGSPRCPGLGGPGGSHTAGNSPGVNDGAGALVLASDEWAEREDREVLAEIVAQAAVADEFAYLARTPANAALAALDKAGLQPGDIDLWEINEAFASVALNSIADARHRRGARERQRRRGGHRPSRRRLGRPHPRRARARAAPARRRLRLRGDLLRRRPGRRGHRPRRE